MNLSASEKEAKKRLEKSLLLPVTSRLVAGCMSQISPIMLPSYRQWSNSMHLLITTFCPANCLIKLKINWTAEYLYLVIKKYRFPKSQFNLVVYASYCVLKDGDLPMFRLSRCPKFTSDVVKYLF